MKGWDPLLSSGRGHSFIWGYKRGMTCGYQEMVLLLRSQGSANKNNKIIFHQSSYLQNIKRQFLGKWKGLSITLHIRKVICSRCQETLTLSYPEPHNSSGTCPKGISLTVEKDMLTAVPFMLAKSWKSRCLASLVLLSKHWATTRWNDMQLLKVFLRITE